MKFYAVKTPTEKKIFSDWNSCKEYVCGLKNVQYKSFATEEEAKEFLDPCEPKILSGPVAYIDGSYDVKTGRYSFGAVLLTNNNIMKFKRAFDPDEYSSARNVAGEIKGAGFIMQYAINHNFKTLHIVYDYAGIENWYTGVWQAKSPIALVYKEFIKKISSKLAVSFEKVKSHTNNKYNDMADRLAKEALNIN